MKQSKWMPRKLYKIADISSSKKEHIPGMSILAGNTARKPITITNEMIGRTALLICYGNTIEQCASLFNVSESELRNRLRLWNK